MRYFTFVAALQFAITACSDPHRRTPRLKMDPPEADEQEVQGTQVPDNLLCIDLSDSQDEMELTPRMDATHGPCEDQFLEEEIAVSKDEPFTLELYGSVDVEYCIAVQRLSGYMTISHEHGTVHRSGSSFTWCITPLNSLHPETALIRSLTTSAQVTVSVW